MDSSFAPPLTDVVSVLIMFSLSCEPLTASPDSLRARKQSAYAFFGDHVELGADAKGLTRPSDSSSSGIRLMTAGEEDA